MTLWIPWRKATADLLAPLTTDRRLGVVTDMDGTLSPIVDEPSAAQVTPRSRELLAALAALLPLVAVVSGRAVADVQGRVGLDGLTYVGNHGLEQWVDGRVVPVPAAAEFRPAVEAALADLSAASHPGMWIEDKGVTISAHYRQTADPVAVGEAFRTDAETIAARHGLRLFSGRMVYELRPPLDMDKGSTFKQLIESHQLTSAVYLGDDTTDMDALRMARHLRGAGTCYAVGFGVDSPDAPPGLRDSADVFGVGVDEVEAFLTWLLKARQASST